MLSRCFKLCVAGALLVSAAPTSNLPISAYSGIQSTPVETATASAASPSATLTLPGSSNRQPTCDSLLFCPGEILQAVQLASIFEDSKTFVDKPARYPTEQIVAAFRNITSGGRSPTYQDMVDFVDENFLGEGLDLGPAEIEDYVDAPAFLENVTDPVVQGFMYKVHSYWPRLARQSIPNVTCDECESTFIPLNRTFVVPGGRFREMYYWDTYWVLEGLLKSEIYSVSKNILLNFFDEIELFGGFIPNGNRQYYLNRSQPPFLTSMVWLYIETTGDYSVLERGLPTLEREMRWWKENRFSPVTIGRGKTIELALYDVTNSAPRPESYREDYYTAFGEPGEEPTGFSNDTIDNLYANLASGAESGIDYSSARWAKEPLIDPTDIIPSLRTLNTNQIVPVDLNSILCQSYRLIGLMYTLNGSTYDKSKSDEWASQAETYRTNIIDTFWDEERSFFYDFNRTASSRNIVWTPASFYPLWAYILPESLLSNQTKVQETFSSLSYVLANYNGSAPPASLLSTGQQWDAPSIWPPHVYMAAMALEHLPANLTTGLFSEFSSAHLGYSEAIARQTNVERNLLPKQEILGSDANITSVSSFNQLGNLGEPPSDATWRDGLVTAIVNRYISSAYCSWYATGGQIEGLVPQASQAELNATDSIGNTGNMFEKFSLIAIDQAGTGGEYTVQTGFGWSNGVALWASNYGDRLSRPTCPSILLETSENSMKRRHIGGQASEARAKRNLERRAAFNQRE